MSHLSQRSSCSDDICRLLQNPEFAANSEADAKSRTSPLAYRLETFQKDTLLSFQDLWSKRRSNNQKRKRSAACALRLEGGQNNLPTCKYKPPPSLTTECTGKDREIVSIQTSAQVTVLNVHLTDIEPHKKLHSECQRPKDQGRRNLSRTRATQTLYRESSAQTLPHLPGVRNERQCELDGLELFRLPTILPGDGPPGVYEVEVLERARKRWAFMKALKENFRHQFAASEELRLQNKMMEVFEWEHWIEREEYIQHCQMLRLEIVLRMFEKREREMHVSAQSRMELYCGHVAAKREEGLRKNGIEYDRQLRRLDLVKTKTPTNWRKENIVTLLGDPASEFYVPQLRYGVHPNRRHYAAEKKAFDARMGELDRKNVNINVLLCPFAKLRELSRPKTNRMEVELNFCSDANLKKLYEQLTSLREQGAIHKSVPKCLKKKVHEVSAETELPTEDEPEPEPLPTEESEDAALLADRERKDNEAGLRMQVYWEKVRAILLSKENRAEELEAMITEYEGSTIGWVMRFLSDEMNRLQEQQNLLFITMMAQKERWRREAAEAGLRQKENEMREIYEQIFQRSNEASVRMCSDYLENVLTVDTKDYAEQTATTGAAQLARVIDNDIQRWLQSLTSIQNPLNYQRLRCILKDLIFPDRDQLAQRYESELVVQGIIIDLLPHVETLLESYDISTTIGNDTIDRLIDNDLCLFSDDTSDDSEVHLSEREAHDILRKMIRQAVPERRWMTPSERDADANIADLLNEMFARRAAEEKERAAPAEEELAANLDKVPSFIDLVCRTPSLQSDPESHSDEELMLFMQSTLIEQFSEANLELQLEDAAIRADQLSEAEQPQAVPFETTSRMNLAIVENILDTSVILAETETAAIRPETETAAIRPETETAAIRPETETAAIRPETETAAIRPENETAAFILQLIYDLMPREGRDEHFVEPSEYEEQDQQFTSTAETVNTHSQVSARTEGEMIVKDILPAIIQFSVIEIEEDDGAQLEEDNIAA